MSLLVASYDYVLSIEHEDALASIDGADGISAGHQVLLLRIHGKEPG